MINAGWQFTCYLIIVIISLRGSLVWIQTKQPFTYLAKVLEAKLKQNKSTQKKLNQIWAKWWLIGLIWFRFNSFLRLLTTTTTMIQCIAAIIHPKRSRSNFQVQNGLPCWPIYRFYINSVTGLSVYFHVWWYDDWCSHLLQHRCSTVICAVAAAATARVNQWELHEFETCIFLVADSRETWVER